MTVKDMPADETQSSAFYDLIFAVAKFGATHMKHLDDAALLAIEKAIEDGGAKFVTQVEHSPNDTSRVTVLLKVADELDEHRLIPVCVVEEKLQLFN